MIEQIMVFNLPRTSLGAKSELLTMFLWRKAFSATKIVLFLKKRKEKFCSNKRKCAKKTSLKYFFLSFWNISMFFQLLFPLPKLGFKIDQEMYKPTNQVMSQTKKCHKSKYFGFCIAKCCIGSLELLV